MAGQNISHEGHRQRMRARVEQYGLESLAPHEALEYLLYITNARRDTNGIAHALLERFGSFAGVLEASEEELCRVPGVGPASARMLHLLPEVSRYYEHSRTSTEGALTTIERLAAYLKPRFAGAKQEKALLLSLDSRSRVKSVYWLKEGNSRIELLTGIWHGANWNFICWGLYYFVLLALEKLFLLPYLKKGRVWPHIYTLFLVVVGWAMFVGNDAGVEFGLLFRKLFIPSGGVMPLYFLRNYGVLLAVSVVCCTPLIEKLWKLLSRNAITKALTILVLLTVSMAYVVGSTNSPFLYFNF